MMKTLRHLGLLAAVLIGIPTAQAQTIGECQQAARENYPLVRRYDLIGQTANLSLSNISKAWLPQISASAQATWQNHVVTLPEGLQQMMSQQGQEVLGLRKEQYRVGIDIQQTVYDGGAVSSQKAVTRRQAEVQKAQTDTELYQLSRRVNELYFGLLLIDEQIHLNSDLQQLLQTNEDRLTALYNKGVAAESDYLAVKAERLQAAQQLISLQSQRQSLASVLALFCGMEQVHPVMPDEGDRQPSIAEGARRPELELFDRQELLTKAREQVLDTQLRPRLSLFATGYYGYPGYDMYHDMFHRDLSFNTMLGVRLQWNIGALYTRRADKQRLAVERQDIGVQRDVFLFNNRLETQQQDDDLRRYIQLSNDDNEIIQLRQAVRQAAESKLTHGIIETSDLLREINSENVARINQSIHQVEWMKALYEKKFTTNQ